MINLSNRNKGRLRRLSQELLIGLIGFILGKYGDLYWEDLTKPAIEFQIIVYDAADSISTLDGVPIYFYNADNENLVVSQQNGLVKKKIFIDDCDLNNKIRFGVTNNTPGYEYVVDTTDLVENESPHPLYVRRKK